VFLVNISVHGAYCTPGVPGGDGTAGEWPNIADELLLRFSLPGNDQEIGVRGQVTWVNQKQQHPVHSLPPGFGVRFRDLLPADGVRIARMIDEYLAVHPEAGR
jgi:Tfp pilus assembly protein PilZ